MAELIKALSALLFPDKCPFCGELMEPDVPCCVRCAQGLPFIPQEICIRCGMGKERCDHHHSHCYEGVAGALYYQGSVPGTVSRFKFKGKANIGRGLAQMMAQTYRLHYGQIAFDWIASVPMLPKKEKQRGYNQADILAENLSRLLGIPFDKRILCKNKDNEAQHSLGNTARQENVKGVYAVSGVFDLKGKNILLVDDIKTTGATFDECARQLKAAGVGQVWCLAACITPQAQGRRK